MPKENYELHYLYWGWRGDTYGGTNAQMASYISFDAESDGDAIRESREHWQKLKEKHGADLIFAKRQSPHLVKTVPLPFPETLG